MDYNIGDQRAIFSHEQSNCIKLDSQQPLSLIDYFIKYSLRKVCEDTRLYAHDNVDKENKPNDLLR